MARRFLTPALAAALAPFLVTVPVSAQPVAEASLTATECQIGAYRGPDGDFVALARSGGNPNAGLRYLFRDGRRGATGDVDAPVRCQGDTVRIGDAAGTKAAGTWARIAFRETPTTFDSAGSRLSGMLIEPPGSDPRRPLVVMVHGSERSSPIGGIYGYAMAAQGLAVFVYDKRGTGASEGEYTQNFELLANDAAAALKQARAMTPDRTGRTGFFGGSQGGWVAPLAATLTPADFVAVGFGLVASPIEEDREQMVAEVRAAGLGQEAEALVNRLSQATARLLLTNFSEGYDEIDSARALLANQPWVARIHGEHSGAMLRMSNDELRRIGRARFDNLELIWDYDAVSALRRLRTPLLWVLAGEDQEAPIETTRSALLGLRAEGRPVDLYLFPGTDHGMIEFTAGPDGSRRYTRITDGYLKLLGDWMKSEARGAYGRAEHLTAQ
ncbi:MAG: alpha/beta hydrolase [Sphingopyxis sp.]|uniref:alpha/beta hydrolase family protein n=1 Tax=Sphingopyxis sp. TaxID=1908224 RepID=UPI002ABC7D59|nr:alpha/beta hydrolase [Sphingopyxis sp.]MDZ3833069.1 alpha/beta hydrolase [Sphingopyxis sp.]